MHNTYRVKLAIIVLFCFSTRISAQVVSIFAGGGSGTGFGVPATSIALGGALAGMNCDKYGNIYIAQQFSNSVVMIDTLGYIYPVAGTGSAGFGGDNGPATAALLSQPQNIGFDTSGNIFIADATNARIRKIDRTTGIITTVCGNGTQDQIGDGGPAINAHCLYPLDVKFDRNNNMYIASAVGGSIRKVNTHGTITKIAGLDSSGNTGDGGPASLAKVVAAFLYITLEDEIYFAGVAGSESIRKIDRYGIISHVAGKYHLGYFNGDGIPATDAGFNPQQFVVAPDGSIYLSDYFNRIRYVDRAGIIHTFLGDGTSSSAGDGGLVDSAKTYHPCGMTFDKCNNIVFAQIDEPRLRKITFDHCNYLSTQKIENTIKSFTLFPNPCNENLTVETDVPINSIVVYNLFGQILFEEKNQGAKKTMDTKNWVNGLYFIQLNGEFHKFYKYN